MRVVQRFIVTINLPAALLGAGADMLRCRRHRVLESLGSRGTITEQMTRSGTVLTSRSPHARAWRGGSRARDHSPRRANSPQLWVSMFAQNQIAERAIARQGRINGLCDVAKMPVICPTCQVFCRQYFAQSASEPATARYCAWGCFRYFGLGATLALPRDPLLQWMQRTPE